VHEHLMKPGLNSAPCCSGWVNRGLEQEKWVPVSERNPVAQVSGEPPDGTLLES
jgi:hypothetical protein